MRHYRAGRRHGDASILLPLPRMVPKRRWGSPINAAVGLLAKFSVLPLATPLNHRYNYSDTLSIVLEKKKVASKLGRIMSGRFSVLWFLGINFLH